jgi:hypothetical protein
VKNWILGIGLAILPACYVGLMMATHERKGAKLVGME